MLVLLTDDQTVRDMQAMPNVQALIGDRGATFANSFSNNPLCCPARASLLTGQYSHNHGVYTNRLDVGGGFPAFDDSSTLGTWMQEGGYLTGYVGKYLNGYGQIKYGHDPTYVPPGWGQWNGSLDPSTYNYYHQSLNENGVVKRYDGVYATTLAARKTRRFIESAAGQSEPFFLFTSFLAPHFGAPIEVDDPSWGDGRGYKTPAVHDKYRNDYAGLTIPQDPNFNEADVSDKPAGIASRPLLGDSRIADLTEQYQQRLESLRSVDEAIAGIIATLEENAELENTVIVFTSDNGLLSGEHRLTGKKRMYESSIRVPLMIRGPGIPVGVEVKQLVGTIDVAPTIVDAAKVQAGLPMDGRSMLPMIADSAAPPPWRTMLLETGSSVEPTLSIVGIRTRWWMYAERGSGEDELYDIRNDPFELENRAGDPDYAFVEERLADSLDALRDCSGVNCR